MAKTSYKSVGLKPATAKFLNDLASELNTRANGIVDIRLTTGLDILAKRTTVSDLANLIAPTVTKNVTVKKSSKVQTKRAKRVKRTNPEVLNSLYQELIAEKNVKVNVGTKQESRKVATSLYNKAYVSGLKVSVKRAGKGKGFVVELV